MSMRSHGKDVQQKKSAKKKRDTVPHTKDGTSEQQQTGRDFNDMNEEARQEEKQLMAATATAVLARLDDDEQKDKKLKKERRKSRTRNRPEGPDNDVEEVPPDPQKGQETVLVADSIDNPKSKARKKKMAKDAAESEPLSQPENKDNKTKKSSKRKHADCSPDAPENVPAGTVDQDQEPQKKRKKPKIVNPKKDETLSEQALKALAYAYSQYRHPEQWKFNKARQNWITRNVWSADMIPDQHLPLVTWYMKNVKGGVRDALIQKCQSHVQAPSQTQPETKATTTEPVLPLEPTPMPLFGLTPEALGKPSENAAEIKRSRAQILLDALQVS